MDFDDEIIEMDDATDVYSLIDLFRSSDTEMTSDEDDYDAGFIFDTDDSVDTLQQNYTILNFEDIRQRQEADITNISTVLSISRVNAIIVLLHYNWSVDDVQNAWFTDEEHVRRKVGLLEGPVIEIPNDDNLTCAICLNSCPRDTMKDVACGHLFCFPCWEDYVGFSIKNGPGCLMLRCPTPSKACGAAVSQDMINLLASDEDRQKYYCFLVRSYVELSRKIKWCPAPGCDYAVEYFPGSESYDVFCNCAHSFCWNCTEETHRPVDCSTVAKWILKNSDESDSMSWIFVNSKPCPRCKRLIERDQGCMHVKCLAPCNFEFCWLCLGAWSAHSYGTGGYYDCISHKRAKLERASIMTEQKTKRVAKELERYAHYYERWATNQSSMRKATENLQQVQSVQIRELRAKLGLPLSAFNFITEAWLQIIECTRVLKWSYVYGYYSAGRELAKRRFFEFRQGLAKSCLTKLHQVAENLSGKVLSGEVLSDPFKEFTDIRAELVELTSIAKKHFQLLVLDMEEGLPDVESEGPGTTTTDGPGVEVQDSKWSCDFCTFENIEGSEECEVCEQPR